MAVTPEPLSKDSEQLREALAILKRILVWADEPEAGDDTTYRTHKEDVARAERFLLDHGETLP